MNSHGYTRGHRPAHPDDPGGVAHRIVQPLTGLVGGGAGGPQASPGATHVGTPPGFEGAGFSPSQDIFLEPYIWPAHQDLEFSRPVGRRPWNVGRQSLSVALSTQEKGALTPADLYEAVTKGALLRLRPKVMAVSTIVAGLLPLMWSQDVGAEVIKPLATPVLGGMISSLIHVLIVTPVIFYWLRERELKKDPSAHAAGIVSPQWVPGVGDS